MNFDEAIRAHGEWKFKLADYVRKPDRSLDAGKVGRDDACALGQWIHGEAAVRFVKSAELAKLRTEHARFHEVAAAIVKRADAGEKLAADVAIGAASPFADASLRVVSAITAMKKALVPHGR